MSGAAVGAKEDQAVPTEEAEAPDLPPLSEEHYTIRYGDRGHTYESIVGPYLSGVREVVVEDPYIRATHQIQNFVRFCEAVLKHSTVKKIKLVTSWDDEDGREAEERLAELKQSLLEADVVLEVQVKRGCTIERSDWTTAGLSRLAVDWISTRSRRAGSVWVPMTCLCGRA